MSEETLGRFDHHPDPAIDFEIEVQSLQARLFDAKGKISKPGTEPEPLAMVYLDITKAMAFVVGGDPSAVAAKQVLRELETEALAALRSKPVASGAAEMQNAICQALLDAFPMDDKIADNYAAVAVKALSALLPKTTAPVVSEPAYWAVHAATGVHIGLWLKAEDAMKVWQEYPDGKLTPLYASPQPQPEAVITEEMVERVWLAVLDCPHTITGQEIILRHAVEKEGRNATNQLRERITAALKEA